MKKVVVFDFDGTLVDSLGLKGEVFFKLFESFGPDIQNHIKEIHQEHPGMSRFDKFKKIYDKLKKPYSELDGQHMSDRFDILYQEMLPRITLFPGVKEFLDFYKERVTFYIVSASRYNEISAILDKNEIRGYFKAIYGYPHQKQDIIRRIIDEGVSPSDIMMIGDSVEDLRAAQENGVDFVQVSAGFFEKSLSTTTI